MVKVLPKNDAMRRLLKHPSNNVAFREEGPMEWPDDSFTHRRIQDGDVTVVEEEKKDEPVPAPESVTVDATTEEQPVERARRK